MQGQRVWLMLSLLGKARAQVNSPRGHHIRLAPDWGWVFGAYGMYSTNMEWQNNQISTGSMMIEQVSNVIGFIPTYGTAWSIGWNLGQDYGPSTWYGKNDYKWFE